MDKLFFTSDYMEGAHEQIMNALMQTNFEHTTGYGLDEYCESAKELIRKAINAPKAEVEFLVGGTQANSVVITALLRSYEGVISADSGHIAVHEAGAVENGGHKVLTIAGENGKITGEQIRKCLKTYYEDGNREHLVKPGMVYISQPTEYGTLYSKNELIRISEVCKEYGIYLYVDGARLAYALGSKTNDVTLEDLAEYADVFYIGGTKCGAMFGEAVVIPDPNLIPCFFTFIKQHGALLAKGRLLGIQFKELFKDGLYYSIGEKADEYADRIQTALKESGYQIFIESPTNQVFAVIKDTMLEKFAQKVNYSFIEKYDDSNTVIRLCTSWATSETDVNDLINLIRSI